MPILTDFIPPSSAKALDLPTVSKGAPFFISFHASVEPNTGKPWCPDVVAALPVLREAFSPDHAPNVAFVEVGQRPEWRDPKNIFRTKWNLTAVPTLVRFESVDGTVKEVGRLVEGQILDRARLSKFISSREARI
ncbi:hypothetical protein BJY01DRAFT_219412 [Aspergillus pseudoustus]|uniref:Thioredoxin domain-containing protein n=1 Tax=Aspergillus pseudoustus TaxID=1810923 RepID=A0ABR4JGD0_9EURO